MAVITTLEQEKAVLRMSKKVDSYIEDAIKQPKNEGYYYTGNVMYNTVPLSSTKTGANSDYIVEVAAIIELRNEVTNETKYVVATDQYANGDIGALRTAAEIKDGRLSVNTDFAQIVNQAIREQKISKEPFSNVDMIKQRVNDLIAVREDGTLVILTQAEINMIEQRAEEERMRMYEPIMEEDQRAKAQSETSEKLEDEVNTQPSDENVEQKDEEKDFMSPKSDIKSIIKMEDPAKTELLKVLGKNVDNLSIVITRHGIYTVTQVNGKYEKVTGWESSAVLSDILDNLRNPHSTANETIKDGIEAAKTGDYATRYDGLLVDKKMTVDEFDAQYIAYAPGLYPKEVDDVERRTGRKTKILDGKLGDDEKAYKYPEKIALGDRVETIIEQRDIRAWKLQRNVDLIESSGLMLNKDTEVALLEEVDEALVREDITPLQASGMKEKIEAAAAKRELMGINLEKDIDTIVEQNKSMGREEYAKLEIRIQEAVDSGEIDDVKAAQLKEKLEIADHDNSDRQVDKDEGRTPWEDAEERSRY